MEDYIIKRNKVKLFRKCLFLSGFALLFSWLTLDLLVSGSWGQLSQWVSFLTIAFVAIVMTYISIVYCGQLVFGKSEFLKLTQEGFYYTGYGMGRKVYSASWKEVDKIFYTELSYRSRSGPRVSNHYICVDFKHPEVWEQQFSINRSKSKLVHSLARYMRRIFKNDALRIPLSDCTDPSDKQIRHVIALMIEYRYQARIKEKNP